MLRFFEKQPSCLVGIEACGSSHYWAREIAARGHDVRLIPPGYVKPFVKRGKTDAADAEAISEAVIRTTMRFVPVKSIEHLTADLTKDRGAWVGGGAEVCIRSADHSCRRNRTCRRAFEARFVWKKIGFVSLLPAGRRPHRVIDGKS